MTTIRNRFARTALAAGCCLIGVDLMADNVYLKYNADGHWSDPSIWANDVPPSPGDTVRLYSAETGGRVIVETEADWAEFLKAGEAVLYYGAQLTLHTDTDRVCTVPMGGGANGSKVSKLFKTGAGKLTMATQNFKDITVVSNGWMTMGPTSYGNAGVYEVAECATLEVNPSANTYMLGLRGAGTVTGTGGRQLCFVTSAYAGKGAEALPPHHFSGTLTGSIDLTAGFQGGSTHRVEGQYFDNADTSTLSSSLRLYNGIFNVRSVGTKTKSDPSSIGNSTLSYFGTYNTAGDTLGLRVTGDAPYATDKQLSASYLADKPGRFMVFDGGPYGGVTFNGRWTFYSPYSETEATCFILDGSNTAACVVDCEVVERLNDKGAASASGHVFVKRGSGTWRLTSKYTHDNRGPILVERGRLEYESLAEAGEYCSLGLMTRWTTNFWLNADCPAVSFAYLLGNGDNTVSPETATMAYTGASAASCATRPLALRGAGRFANDSDFAMSYAGATAAEADEEATLVLAGKSGGSFAGVTNGVGRLSVVKEGAGTWNLPDGVDLAAVTVKEGALTVGMNYEFYRWTITANNGGDGGTWIAAFNGFAIMDEAGNMLNGTLGKSGLAKEKNGYPEQLEPGEICYSSYAFAQESNKRPIDRGFDWDPVDNKFRDPDATIEITVKKDEPATHPVVYFRTDPGVRVAKYDVMASGNVARDVVCWELAGSVDGKAWDPLHTRETNSVTGYVPLSAGQWHSTGTATRGGWDIPCGKAGATFSIGSVGAATGATLAFVGNAAGTVVSNIVLSANGGGTITGAAIATAGTIDITDFDRSKLDVEIPLDLTGCADSARVGAWTLKVNGKPAKNGFRVTATGVTVRVNGLVIIMR